MSERQQGRLFQPERGLTKEHGLSSSSSSPRPSSKGRDVDTGREAGHGNGHAHLSCTSEGKKRELKLSTCPWSTVPKLVRMYCTWLLRYPPQHSSGDANGRLGSFGTLNQLPHAWAKCASKFSFDHGVSRFLLVHMYIHTYIVHIPKKILDICRVMTATQGNQPPWPSRTIA